MRKTTFTIIFVASVCVTILTSIAVVAPKAVRAAVATLIRDQDNAARHPWSANCGLDSPTTGCTLPLPSGSEYVIQSVSFLQYGSQSGPNYNAVIVEADCTSGGTYDPFFNAIVPVVPTLTVLPGVAARQTFPVTAYCDAGLSYVNITLNGAATPSGLFTEVVLNGYYVTLP